MIEVKSLSSEEITKLTEAEKRLRLGSYLDAALYSLLGIEFLFLSSMAGEASMNILADFLIICSVVSFVFALTAVYAYKPPA